MNNWKCKFAQKSIDFVGYHCSGSPIAQHDDLAGLIGLLDTDYGSEIYGSILRAIGKEQATDLADNEPNEITSKEGRQWCDEALRMIMDYDLRILFVSDRPETDYGSHCYGISFPKGSKVYSFTDYNVPGATCYVFKSNVKPIFTPI